jgi:ribonuclease P protein component
MGGSLPADAAAPPIQRLKRRREFLRAAQKGKRAARPGLVLQAVPNGTDTLRVGFTVTKKVGNAVTRNRAKRRLREAARLSLPAQGLSGYDLVLIGRDGTIGRPFERLVSDLAGALRQCGVAEP